MMTEVTTETKAECPPSTVRILADRELRTTDMVLPDEGCCLLLSYDLLAQERGTLLAVVWFRYGYDDDEPQMHLSGLFRDALSVAGLDPEDLSGQRANHVWSILEPVYKWAIKDMNDVMLEQARKGELEDFLDLAA